MLVFLIRTFTSAALFIIGSPVLLLQKTVKAILYTLFKCSVIVIVHYKHIMINANNMKLILNISIMTGSNYFDLIDASNYFTSAAPVSAIIICCLHSAPALPTTAAALSSPSLSTTVSLPLPSTNRVSTHQIAVSDYLLALVIT
ncbi:hypothetical protein CISG_10192 [Coccidioides immitis RMSCC 3703]|uniref:Uncharacterized protein n=2 Tax=Coccidioides immitis TaxID=5501 RepID=A0A0J8QNM5_COCIT|nr:hypothetical protein CIRG_04112 [Coccidioides immitis RMSCC 2394]KMU74044.1 hypothetical protein CISG_10192 [Coccidioides immitis RMSCC 3703]